MSKKFIFSLVNVLVLCVVIFSVSAFFIYDTKAIGYIVFGLGVVCLLYLKLLKLKIRNLWPDIIFGIIDNGILAVFAVWGGEIAGIAGAIIGGVVGNAITDGIAGVFEGRIAEKLRGFRISDRRTMLGSAIGKMAGCLLGAGFVLIITSFI